jgi:hypothetical protein
MRLAGCTATGPAGCIAARLAASMRAGGFAITRSAEDGAIDGQPLGGAIKGGENALGSQVAERVAEIEAEGADRRHGLSRG